MHALRNLTIKNTGIEGIYTDVLIYGFSAIMIAGSIALFKRQLYKFCGEGVANFSTQWKEPASKIRGGTSDHECVGAFIC